MVAESSSAGTVRPCWRNVSSDVSLFDFVQSVIEIMLLRLETSELIERCEGRRGGVVADRAGMEREQITVETIILRHTVGIALNNHLRPMTFEFHHIRDRRVGGSIALGGEPR